MILVLFAFAVTVMVTVEGLLLGLRIILYALWCLLSGRPYRAEEVTG